MSSVQNHRRRSRRGYEKRVAEMNTFRRRSTIKKESVGLVKRLIQRRQKGARHE